MIPQHHPMGPGCEEQLHRQLSAAKRAGIKGVMVRKPSRGVAGAMAIHRPLKWQVDFDNISRGKSWVVRFFIV